MGNKDAEEMLEAAREECVRLEHQVAELLADRDLVDVRRNAVIAAAEWLEALRHEAWNGSQRRPSNYHRAAQDLVLYAHRTYERTET